MFLLKFILFDIFTCISFFWITYLFGLLTFLLVFAGSSKKNFSNFKDFKYMPVNSGAWIIVAASLISFAGLPPMIGFWGKALLLFTCCKHGAFLFAFLMTVVALFSLFFYLNFLRYLFAASTKKSNICITHVVKFDIFLLSLLFIVFFGFLFLSDLYLISSIVTCL